MTTNVIDLAPALAARRRRAVDSQLLQVAPPRGATHAMRPAEVHVGSWAEGITVAFGERELYLACEQAQELMAVMARMVSAVRRQQRAAVVAHVLARDGHVWRGAGGGRYLHGYVPEATLPMCGRRVRTAGPVVLPKEEAGRLRCIACLQRALDLRAVGPEATP